MIPIISINHHFGLSKKHATQKCVDHHFANQNKSLTWGEIASFSDTLCGSTRSHWRQGDSQGGWQRIEVVEQCPNQWPFQVPISWSFLPYMVYFLGAM